MIILNKTNRLPILKVFLFLAFSQLLFAQTYIAINSGSTGSLSATNAYNTHYASLPSGRSYTVTAGGGDTKLYVNFPGGGQTTNEDWGGMTDPKFSQVTGVSAAGSYTFYVQSSAGAFNYFIYITDVSPCSGSCTSKLFSWDFFGLLERLSNCGISMFNMPFRK